MTVRVLAQKDGTTAEDHRLGMSVFMAGAGAAALDRRSGIVPYVGSCDLTGVSPMVGRVSPFAAWVDGTSNSLQGGYPVVVDANTDLTFDNGEAGNSRIDRVVLQIRDNPYDSSGSQDGRVVIVKGQAGGAANAIPASSLLLWEVTVPTGATIGGGGFTMSSARSDKRTYASALGGLIDVATSTERDLMTPYEGLHVWRRDGKARQVYTGSAWRWMDTVVCSSSANRDSLIPSGERYTGQVVFRSDKVWTEIYTGTAWVPIGLGTIDAEKPSDTTRATTTTNSADPHLSVSVDIGTYDLRALLLYSADSSADIRMGWTGPASTTMDWICHALPNSGSGTSGSVILDRQSIASQNFQMGGAAAGTTAVLTGTVTGRVRIVNAGTFAYNWSQGTSNATGSILRAGSCFTLRRVA